MPQRYIITADAQSATLHRFTPTASRGWHVESLDSITNQWEDDHEHHRPIALGRGFTANAAQSFASPGHEQEEELRRFARDIQKWVETQMRHAKSNRLTLFAPPRLLGALRAQFANDGEQVNLIQGDFASLQPHELAKHASIQAALSTPSMRK